MREIRSLREKIWQEELFPACNQKGNENNSGIFAQKKQEDPSVLHKRKTKRLIFFSPSSSNNSGLASAKIGSKLRRE